MIQGMQKNKTEHNLLSSGLHHILKNIMQVIVKISLQKTLHVI